jgi:predicted regulator of Ras-like GTPase activity (Roadblock/LC7/MglB family)
MIGDDWFERLAENPHIEAIVVADNQGGILRSTRELRSDHEQAASMVQAMEVLAQTLSAALHCGPARMVQLSTDRDHILLFPLAQSTYFLVVQARRTAPLALLMVELERVVSSIRVDDLVEMREVMVRADDTPVLDAAELIDAVREWLQNRPTQE